MKISLLALAIALLTISCSADALSPKEATSATLSVATYNVNFGLAGDQETLDAIFESGVDIVSLQESTPDWEFFIEQDPRAQDYPHRLFLHSRGAGGLAMLSKYPIAEIDTHPGVEGWFPAWLLEADSPLGKIQILAVHLRPPVSNSGNFVTGYFQRGDIHSAEMEAFAQLLEPTTPAIVLGDFNEDPGGAALEMLQQQNFNNVLPLFEPGAMTWSWVYAGILLEGAYDHILASPTLAPLDAKVLKRGRSDHLPVVAIFELEPDGFELDFDPISGYSMF